ncbi:hypothetical protein BHECKSOX_1524 [Bathymodiolus heckerae thiotrophic gill symbiont]|nr:hypothetical protein [uncultured Gammaproteobacteria bacterium]SHN89254.1 hypothetical protein BHECKSOX_1524 [Bathymodiolus heckerae thiotrophic gill symbiont]
MQIDINEMIPHIEVRGVQRKLISSCFICEFMNIHRRLIQNLVRHNKIKMYNGLLDYHELLRLFPNFQKINLI